MQEKKKGKHAYTLINSTDYLDKHLDAYTFFWLDHWIGDSNLADTFPALFSHCLRRNVSVALVLGTAGAPPTLHLRPWLSSAAASELNSLLSLLDTVSPQPDLQDTRTLLGSSNTELSSSNFYRLSFSHLPDDIFCALHLEQCCSSAL